MKRLFNLAALFFSVGIAFFGLNCGGNHNPASPGSPSPTMTSTQMGTPASTGTPTNTATPTSTATVTPTFSVPTPAYLGQWTTASAPQGFYEDFTVSPPRLYVAESGAGGPMVEVFNTSNGTVLASWNTEITGCALGTTLVLNNPRGLAFTPNNTGGSFFCLLDGNGSGGATLYAGPATGEGPVFSTGYSSLAFNNPQGLATDLNYLYAADTGNGYVDEFDPDALTCPSALLPIHRWNGSPSYPFAKPAVLAVDPGGDVWVGDTGYNPSFIQEFTSGATTWITRFPAVANCVVGGMAVTTIAGQDYIYVSDTGNALIEEYNANGNLLRDWGNPHGPHEPLPFSPSCLQIDSPNNRIFVGDPNNDTVDFFGP